MKLAIMQPYFLPYIGYFQLINAVDKFVIYDDVNYINKGWINRNQILVNGQIHIFTIPLSNASQNRKINEVELNRELNWSSKILKTIEQAYKKAPQYSEVMPVIADIFNHSTSNIAEYNYYQLRILCQFMQINTTLERTSAIYQNQNLKGQERILDICLRENADTYINPIGGMDIYDPIFFEKKGISLYFIRSLPVIYTQFKNDFLPWLSVLDVLMHNDLSQIKEHLTKFTLIKKETI